MKSLWCVICSSEDSVEGGGERWVMLKRNRNCLPGPVSEASRRGKHRQYWPKAVIWEQEIGEEN